MYHVFTRMISGIIVTNKAIQVSVVVVSLVQRMTFVDVNDLPLFVLSVRIRSAEGVCVAGSGPVFDQEAITPSRPPQVSSVQFTSSCHHHR